MKKSERESQKKAIRKYRENHPEKVVKWGKDYYNRHKERKIKYAKERNIRLKKQVLKHYGNKCICCGEKTYEFLSIDHVNKNGNKRKKIGASFYKWIIDNHYPKDLQILCFNCNCAKGFFGYCPHQKRKE